MHHEITMKWTQYVTGTVKGTIFDGANWVEQFAMCETPLEAAKLFNTIFKDQWSMSTSEIPHKRTASDKLEGTLRHDEAV